LNIGHLDEKTAFIFFTTSFFDILLQKKEGQECLSETYV